MEAIIRGNLGDNPELRHIGATNLPVVRCRVGLRQSKAERERGAPTVWITVQAMGDLAERMASTLIKGHPVLILGHWRRDEWVKDGENRHDTYVQAISGGPDLASCTVSGVQRVKAASQQDAPANTTDGAPAEAPDPYDED